MPLFPDSTDAPTVLTKQSRQALDPYTQLVIDAKGLYDNLISERQSGDDERAALEVSIIKEDLVSLGGKVRWVPHDKNPADDQQVGTVAPHMQSFQNALCNYQGHGF